MNKPSHILVKEKLWSRQASALNTPAYRLTFTHPDPNLAGFNYGKGKGPDGSEKWYSAQEIKDLIPTISAKNSQGYNVYITPKATQDHFILLDDTDQERLNKLQGAGFKPALVQESSPGNLQAVFKVPKPEASAVEQSAGNEVMRRLNKQFGDPNITAVIHPFRMAGFANRKPKYEQQGRFPFVQIRADQGGTCQKMAAVLDETRADHQVEADKLNQARAKVQAEERREVTKNFGASGYSPHFEHKGMTDIDYLFIQERQGQQLQAVDFVRSGKWERVDESAIDFRTCKEMLRYGNKDSEKIKAALIKYSPHIEKQSTNFDRYAQDTVTRAQAAVEKDRALALSRSQDRE